MSTQVLKTTILVVDDDPVQRRLLQAAIEKMGFSVKSCNDGAQAIEAVDQDDNGCISAIILDLMMPRASGHEVLDHLSNRGLAIPTIVQTSQGSIDTAINAMRAGAFDFVVKPVSPDRLKASLADAIKVAERSEPTLRNTKPKDAALTASPTMIASTDEMNRVATLIDRAAQSDIPVLIEGESGTGKELVALTIQSRSARAEKPMVVVNCGAIPDNLVESILFGHEKGAFTGATDKHVGKFVEANGGTLFLDEIGELPLEAQVKLLRAIQYGEVEPVGASTSRKVDIRLISATNRDLISAVREGRFREDLYYRLNVFPILVPPLRHRRGDIHTLVTHFIHTLRNGGQAFAASDITHAALQLLESYDWPGNIRQLENAVFRAMVLCDTSELDVPDFQQIVAQLPANGPIKHVVSTDSIEDIKLAPDYPVGVGDTEPQTVTVTEFDAPASFLDPTGHVMSLADIEASVIKQAITHYDGQMSEVARRLGIGRSTLYRKLKDYSIEPDLLVN